MPGSNFLIQSPTRVLQQAEQYKNTFTQTVNLPSSAKKSKIVHQQAEHHIDEIKYSIERAQYQNNLFKKLQQIDSQRRNTMSRSLLVKSNKFEENNKKNHQKQMKKYQNYQKHIENVRKRYEQEQKKKFVADKQQTNKLRKELKQFYEKQQQQKKLKDKRQISVPRCYENALQKLNRIQKENQQRSRQAQLQLEKSFSKSFRLRDSPQHSMRNSSFDFRKHQNIYQTSLNKFIQNQSRLIQNYAKKQMASSKAFDYKQEQNQKAKKRINQFFKKRSQRWKQQKSRIEQKNKQIPQKCTDKLNKTMNLQLKTTFSTFRESFISWRQNAEQNRSQIKVKDDKHKDKILNLHNDITLKNKSLKQIGQTMLSMKHRATKVAAQFN